METPQPQDKPLSLVDEAKKLRDEIKAENDRRELLLKQEQQLHAERLLGGTGGGHIEQKPIDPNVEAKKRAMDFFKGTEMEKIIERHG